MKNFDSGSQLPLGTPPEKRLRTPAKFDYGSEGIENIPDPLSMTPRCSSIISFRTPAEMPNC
jgi:hypothetical protein